MVQQMSQNILLGVVSGFITAFLIVFVRVYWDKILLPWYEERIYKDAHIEGSWAGILEHSEEDSEEFVLNIRRTSHRVSGEIVSKGNGQVYPFQGEFRNMILTFTYSSQNLHMLDRGCFSFLLRNNGQLLDGQGAFYHPLEHQIHVASIRLTRINQ